MRPIPFMMWEIIRAVVVLPFEPVTATIGIREGAPDGKSMSMTGLATYCASPSVGWVCIRKPGAALTSTIPPPVSRTGSADVRADEVDAGDVEADHLRGQLGQLDVVGVRFLGAVDADPAGAHVAGPLEVDPLTSWRGIAKLEALLADVGDRLVVDLDPGEHLLMSDAAARVGVRDLDELLDRARAVAVHVGGDALSDRAQHATDDQAAVVVAGQEGLDHDAAAAAL